MELNSVTKRFQAKDTSIADMRAILDDVIAKHPKPFDQLSCTANIIVYPLFESAVSKIQDGKEHSLTDEEKEYISRIVKSLSYSHTYRFSLLPLARRVMKRRRFSKNAKSAYIDLRFM